MSAAGTPSTDPWVVLARERARYEEQFRGLHPINGIVTGDQAKGFLLQSQLPPMVLGHIWALSDTDADGKMDINEFSIACKLINLKLRGFEVPKALPPSLLASLKQHTPPAIPPLPNPALIGAPMRPPPTKAAPLVTPPLASPTQPLLANLGMTQAAAPSIPTGIVPPMPSYVPPVSMVPQIGAAMGAVPPMGAVAPMVGVMPPMNVVQPMNVVPPMGTVPPMGMGVTAAPLVPGLAGAGPPLVPAAPISTAPIPHMSPVGQVPGVGAVIGGPSATSTPRASVGSIERALSIESPQVEWAVPHQTKLKYTQVFNTTDRTRTGYLSGPQARNVMVQTKLPHNILAQVWALSDMDSDGRLGCEEFVLAMHLCEQASLGTPPPAALPLELIPPTFRRAPRTGSVSSQGSGQAEQNPASTLPQASFEDKRKENFEKGQAELERRRKSLLDQQRKEAEERERKEREENERREKARLEAEKRRQDELDRQMREQQEQERLKEEERKRQAEQRESARREMERQRQLEWEKQRSQELQQQRQREQENVLRLKAKNQTLSIELTSLNEQVKELSQKICDTRVGVSNVKTTIDGMRSTRDTQMQEMSQLKNRLKEQNAKLIALGHEKAKLDAKNKMNAQMSQNPEQANKAAFDNKEITIKQLKDKIDDLQNQIDGKMTDIENNNSQLGEFKTQLVTLVTECEGLYSEYEEKRNIVLEAKQGTKVASDFSNAWKESNSWGESAPTQDDNWPVTTWESPSSKAATEGINGSVKYRALYEFVARNSDEVSFQPGDIIMVPLDQAGEPGWLAGEIRGHTGWFPESYVEKIDGADADAITEVGGFIEEDIEAKRLEGIAEVPEVHEVAEMPPEETSPAETTTPIGEITGDILEYYIATYPYQSQEQGDLSFNAGEMITVIKKEGEWWTGKTATAVGIFPSNYVQKVDVNTSSTSNTAAAPAASATAVTNNTAPDMAAAAAAAEIVNQNEQNANNIIDNEVSQINEAKMPAEKSPDFAAMSAMAGTLKSGKKPEIAQVIAPYNATSTEQLSLSRGQLIMIRKKTETGWWEGELQAKGKKRQVGWFPASYVKLMVSTGRGSGRTTPVSSTRIQQEIVLDKVVALYAYTASNPDELSFLKDDIISVTAREEEAWWRGELNGVSGLFPSNYVGPLQSYSPQENKIRRDAINELISTEKVYIDDMTVVHDVFELPLRNSRVIGDKTIDGIFVNWQDILQCNRNFLEDLLERTRSGSDVIGDIICSHLPRMTAYIKFCSQQLESASLLQRLTETSPAFRDVVKKCQSQVATKGMPLSSFLIKPMQRITKYPLLIGKILENTPKTHSDYGYLTEALQIADRFLKRLNENVRLKENSERLEWMQANIQQDLNILFTGCTNRLGPRKLLHYGILNKVKSGKELIGFLLNDFFILVQCSKPLNAGQFNFQRNTNCVYKMYRQPIFVPEMSALKSSTDNIENGTDANRVLKIQDKKNLLSLLTPSVNECNLWMKKISSARDSCAKLLSLTKTRPKSKPPSGVTVGRLLVLVQKGKRFISAGKYFVDNIYCKVSMGDQEQVTDTAQDSMNNGNAPQNGVPVVPTLIWNASMQFQVRNFEEDVVNFVVYEKSLFAPDEFLGRAEVRICDVLRETQNTNGPISKKLILHQVESGEIVIKLDLQVFSNSY